MFNYLRELNFVSVALRLLLSAVIGFSLGMERGRKHRPAGCRTYMLVCMGATLTLLLSQYEYYMLTHDWYDLALEVGIRTDVSRFGAQVINGVGFLGAGTILVTGRRGSPPRQDCGPQPVWAWPSAQAFTSASCWERC